MPPGPGHIGRGFLTEEEKQNKPKITGALLKRIFSYLLPYWKQLGLVLVCIIISSVFTLMPSILTGRIIDDGLIGRSMPALVRLILLSLAVTLAANLIGVAESYLNSWIAQHI
ncbi:MAG: ABC transporter ATP-binding protein, partial [Lachnospiraceae bacterium]|nr:ABC transporter ATP-binding protein [Lachnospiraceae bacterium]